MFGPCGPDCTSLINRSASVVHATVGLLSWKPHTRVPTGWSGAALRRHGPGVHSPFRQLSAHFIPGSDPLGFSTCPRSRHGA